MKKQIFSILVFGLWFVCTGTGWSQVTNLIGYEYWFDEEISAKISVSISPTAVYQLNTTLNTAALQPGMHVLRIRFKDDSLRYSTPVSNFFFKNPNASGNGQITGYRYWFDESIAGATNTSVSPTDVLYLNSALNSNSLAKGLHSLHFQAKSGGVWSQAISAYFFKGGTGSSPNKIRAYRYWFDVGGAMTTVTLPQPLDPLFLNLNINAIAQTPGAHKLYLQFQDVNLEWSSALLKDVTVNCAVSITCPPNLTKNAAASGCFWNAINLGTPTTADNCGIATVAHNIPAQVPVGINTYTYTATDVNGNTATCTRRITVADITPPSITCRPALTRGTDATACSATFVLPTGPTVSDNCSATTTNNAPTTFPLGSTTVTYTATDAAGNTATCTRLVTVVDDDAPVAVCPSNVTVQVVTGACTAVANFAIGGTDNCTVSGTLANPASGTAFPVGNTTVTGRATDAAGNTGTCTFTVTVSPAAETCGNLLDDNCNGYVDEPIAVSLASQTNVTCNAASTGAVNVTVGCGLSPYTYAWSNGTSTKNLANIPAGTYTLTVTDAQGLASTLSATVTQPANSLIASFSNTVAINCFGGTGNVRVNPLAPVTGYTYLWNNGITTREIIGVSVGNYTVTVTKTATGCSNVGTYTLTQPAQIAFSFVVTHACPSQANGKIVTTVTGGTGAKTLLWNTGATTATLNNVAAATYTITATDTKGCTVLASTAVTAVSLTAVVTSGTQAGTYKVTLSGSGGTPYTTGGAYRYRKCNVGGVNCSNFLANAVFNNLAAGTYQFDVRDARLCISSINVTVPSSASASGERAVLPKTEHGMLIYPNPASGQSVWLLLRDAPGDMAQIVVMDVLDRVVFRQHWALTDEAPLELPVQDLPSGAYWVRVSFDGVLWETRPFIVARK